MDMQMFQRRHTSKLGLFVLPVVETVWTFEWLALLRRVATAFFWRLGGYFGERDFTYE